MFVFVLAVPNLSGVITASAEADVQIVRLSSVCPPEAIRPHIQEGYLLREYPELGDYDQKLNYANFEVDFGRRLIAKFSLKPKEFWANDNQPDPIYDMAQVIKASIGSTKSARRTVAAKR